jgi:hypothetical protein
MHPFPNIIFLVQCNKDSECIASNTKTPTDGIIHVENSSSITKLNFDLYNYPRLQMP